MTPEIRGILERCFGYARGAAKRLGPPTDTELAAAAAAGYPTDELEVLRHDDVIARLHAVRDRLAASDIAAAFIAGVGGSAPRGLQPLISYAFARTVPAHAATGSKHEHCETCSIRKEADIDRTEELLRCHLGFLWNELPTDWVLDLEELAQIGPPKPTDRDRENFRALLSAIADASADCTPGELEKELARRKVLPHSRDKYQRYGILEALAEVGVLPNAFVAPRWDAFTPNEQLFAASRKVRGSSRSDIVLPFGGWRGSLGVDWRRAEELFGVGKRATAPSKGKSTTRASTSKAMPATKARSATKATPATKARSASKATPRTGRTSRR